MQQCPINDHAKANVTMVDISPKSGPVGVYFLKMIFFFLVGFYFDDNIDTTFTVTGQIQIQNTIGTGEVRIIDLSNLLC